MATYVPAILRDSKVMEAPSTDKISPTQIPISGGFGNIAESRADGIFVGSDLPSPTYYVSSSGLDDPDSGTKAAPFQTLSYALDMMDAIAGNMTGYSVNIAMKAGETFSLVQRHQLKGNFIFTFYGDDVFGDFDNPTLPVPGEYCQDLSRPVITVSPINMSGELIKLAGFTTNYRIEFRGVSVELPVNPGSTDSNDYGTYDLILGDSPNVHLQGSVVNKVDTPSYAGFLGIKARSRATLTEYASQFRIEGAKADTPGAAGLSNRQHFIHFYMDALVNQEPFMFASSVNSNNGYGLLTLNWTDVQPQNTEGQAILESFPTVANVSYGLRNYFMNIQRDQQSRPLNIISSRLL